MTGTLYGLGVGPGDPELVTLKALRLMRAAPVLAYPAPLEGESLARRIAAPHLAGGQTELALRLPFTPERARAARAYAEAAESVAAHLSAGRDVAVLCLGDPFLYGTFGHLAARLAERFAVEVVPGVSSFTAAPAALGRPLAARDDVLTIVPATLPEAALRERLAGAEAAIVIKLGRHLDKVRGVLDGLGLAHRARYVERVTMADERAVALADLTDAEAAYFSMIVVPRAAEPAA